MASAEEDFKRQVSGYIQAGLAQDVIRSISTVCSEDTRTPELVFTFAMHLADLLEKEVARLERNEDRKITQDLGTVLAQSLVEIAKHSNRREFDSCDHKLREISSRYHDLFPGERKKGAEILSRTNVNTAAFAGNDEKKGDLFIRCAEGFLIDNECGAAENMLRKASEFIRALDAKGSASDSITELKRRCTLTQARVDDFNRKFSEAARNYYSLSNAPNIARDERLEYLGKAITCGVLGKAKGGPQSLRVLGLLYKDDRLKELEVLQLNNGIRPFIAHASILTKLYTERLLLDQRELQYFEGSLAEHQTAKLGDGRTHLQKCVLEHNVHAAGKIYENIAFPELAAILRLTPADAESLAAKMISREIDQLRATIDQTESMLVFEGSSVHNGSKTSAGSGSAASSNGTAGLVSWDDRIHDFCKEANDISDELVQLYPALADVGA